MRLDGDVCEISDEDTFRRKVTNKPSKYQKAVVLFSAVWCPPCRVIKSHFHELAQLYKGHEIVFLEVDVEKLRTIANECNVHSVPTFQCYSRGDVVYEVIGPDKTGLEQAVVRLESMPTKNRQQHLEEYNAMQKSVSVKEMLKKLMNIS